MFCLAKGTLTLIDVINTINNRTKRKQIIKRNQQIKMVVNTPRLPMLH